METISSRCIHSPWYLQSQNIVWTNYACTHARCIIWTCAVWPGHACVVSIWRYGTKVHVYFSSWHEPIEAIISGIPLLDCNDLLISFISMHRIWFHLSVNDIKERIRIEEFAELLFIVYTLNIWTHFLTILLLKFNKSIFLFVEVYKTDGRVANSDSADSD